jgi:SecD/SecF fusion protein
MQLKGLVGLVTVVVTVISLYQLSFTQFINSHEAKKRAIATKQVKMAMPNADVKSATFTDAVANRMRVILDSTSNEKVGFGKTYQKAKEQQLALGLDLQGGMNVTLRVGLEEFIRNLAARQGDPAVDIAIRNAVASEANSQDNLITLFVNEFKKANPNVTLASAFAKQGVTAISLNSTNDEVTSYLRNQAKEAVKNTYQVLVKRIDKFGVAQPTINLDENKDIITVELAGVQNPEQVRKLLQSSAKLEFWETYSIHEIMDGLNNADKAYKTIVSGDSTKPDAVTSKDTNAVKFEKFKKENPLFALFAQISQPEINPKTNTYYHNSILGYAFVKDTSALNAALNTDIVRAAFPKNLKFYYGIPMKQIREKDKNILAVYLIKTVPGKTEADLTGESVIDTRADFTQSGEPAVFMNMNTEGAAKWARMTGDNVGKQLAVALDGLVYSAPNSNEKIPNGSTQISGSFTPEETADLANILKSGKLDAPARIVQEQIVGPTLGKENIASGKLSFLISFLVIFALMLLYFNTSGMVANIALIFNLLFTIGVLSSLGATLTMAGIAGLVLTIGMAVDTNVIIFERIKDELAGGKKHTDAINEGYRRSLPPVIDGHLTVLLTAVMLYIFGLGPVRGFATTQILGIVLSLFCGIALSRLITEIYMRKGKDGNVKHLEYFTGISKRIYRKFHFKFIEWRKYAYIISALVLIGGIASYFNGFDQGIEFKGGRSYTVKIAGNANITQVKDALKAQFGTYPQVKTAAGGSMIITTDYLRENTSPDVEAKVQDKLYEGLKTVNAVEAGQDVATFKKAGIISSNAVQPTISDDLKKGAVKATVFSIIIIFAYILVRFRKWQYSLGTVIALLHDVFIMLIVFSFCRKFVPFPLEIDQHFIAAILTVIGFSMNDTVIVFDRIREYFAKRPGVPKAQIINEAINDTLSRTIMTSLTVFLTILILFIVGGEATKGFAFAMLIGVITGTYSSIFVAAPVLVDLDRTETLSQEVDKEQRIAALKEQA